MGKNLRLEIYRYEKSEQESKYKWKINLMNSNTNYFDDIFFLSDLDVC